MSFCHCLVWIALLLFEVGDSWFHLLLSDFAIRQAALPGSFCVSVAGEDFDRLRVGQTIEGRLDFFKSGDVGAESFKFGAVVFQDTADNRGNEIFRQFQAGRPVRYRRLPARPSRIRSDGGGSCFFRRGKSGRSNRPCRSSSPPIRDKAGRSGSGAAVCRNNPPRKASARLRRRWS